MATANPRSELRVHASRSREARESGDPTARLSTRLFVTLACGALLCAAPVATGCIVDNSHSTPADTQIEFQETDNIGLTCSSPLTTWTVTNRETNEVGTAGCEQPVLFVNLTPGAVYTFDISGLAGTKECWKGSCQVTAASGITTLADCSSAIERLCGN